MKTLDDKPLATPEEIEEIRYLMIVAKMKQNEAKIAEQSARKSSSVLSRRRDRATVRASAAL